MTTLPVDAELVREVQSDEIVAEIAATGDSSEQQTHATTADAPTPVAAVVKKTEGVEKAAVQEVDAPKPADIFMLARQQNFPIVSKLLAAYPQFWNARDEDGHSLVHWAALVAANDFIKEALAHNSSFVSAQASNKQTPLMWAVLRSHVKTTKLLLDHKADIYHKDSLGATALMIAIQHRQYEPMLLLLHRGDKDQLLSGRDKNGCTSVHWSAYKGDITALKFLNYFGADMNAVDAQRMLPLHRATSASQHTVVQFLTENRADMSARNADDETPMDIAIKNSDQAMQTVLKHVLEKTEKKNKGNAVTPDLESGTSAELGTPQGMSKDKAAQKIFPVFWLVCVSLAVFQYIMDVRSISYDIAPTASMCFEIGVPLSLCVFFMVALSDPGKLPAKVRGNSGVETVMRALDGQLPPDGKVPDVSRLCTTTWVLKGLRTKYCAQTGACVEDFDHYCVWLNCAIGKGNHRQFVGLAIVEFLTQLFHLYVNWHMSTKLVPYDTFGGWILAVATAYPLYLLISVCHCITVPWVFMLFLHQGRLIVMNMTTNEMMNAHRYEHFWVAAQVGPGRFQKTYRNPFSKGGAVGNCFDFWWTRRRSETGNMDAPVAAPAGHGGDGGHGHGGHGGGHGHGHTHGDGSYCDGNH